MGAMRASSKTTCPTLKRLKNSVVIWFFKERLEPRMLPWQQHSGCRSASFVMYIPLPTELNTTWLAQLVECQSAVQEVDCLSLKPDQHSGS